MERVGKILAVVAAALTLGACGQSSNVAAPASSAPPSSASATAAPPTQSKGRECTADDVKTTGNFGENPTITIPDSCDPPKKLITKDLVQGPGPGAVSGNSLEMNYSLVTWSNKQKLDSSFDRGQPFSLQLGAGMVIPGWDQGLVGIKQGGRRLLIIPPDLGYGAGGQGIKPNETLVFVVDAVKVSPA
jgi:peptidylprolyl isomerase